MRFTAAFVAFIVVASTAAFAAPLGVRVPSVYARDDFSSLTARNSLNELERRAGEDTPKPDDPPATSKAKPAQPKTPAQLQKLRDGYRKFRESDHGKQKKAEYLANNKDLVLAQARKDNKNARARKKAAMPPKPAMTEQEKADQEATRKAARATSKQKWLAKHKGPPKPPMTQEDKAAKAEASRLAKNARNKTWRDNKKPPPKPPMTEEEKATQEAERRKARLASKKKWRDNQTAAKPPPPPMTDEEKAAQEQAKKVAKAAYNKTYRNKLKAPQPAMTEEEKAAQADKAEAMRLAHNAHNQTYRDKKKAHTQENIDRSKEQFRAQRGNSPAHQPATADDTPTPGPAPPPSPGPPPRSPTPPTPIAGGPNDADDLEAWGHHLAPLSHALHDDIPIDPNLH
ncbi:hypothetical protein EIP91_010973 [Steccherinum ochraceum]|uniref:Uncharacterized protein n=1 Tax=Steccherinum ochraceum TaxID=92696 RepID=A0A4R0RQ77_9APHY|nr:hypothetical protein EIP91_010973 [Steccherinum ochraceum]